MVTNRTACKFPGVYVLAIVIVLVGCQTKTVTVDAPEISDISPRWILSNLPFTLTVSGKGFKEDSVIVFNNIIMTTHFVSQGKLYCEIEAGYTALLPLGNSFQVPVYVINKEDSNRGGTVKSDIHFLLIKHQPEFSEPVNICNNASPRYSYLDTTLWIIVNEKPRLYSIWREEDYSPGIYSDFFLLSISTDSGQTWSEPIRIPAGDFFFARNGKLYAWDDSNDLITLYKSEDLGESWTSTNVAALDTIRKNNRYWASLDGEDNLFLVYLEHSYSTAALSILYSSDYGDTWELKGEHTFSTSYYDGGPVLIGMAVNNRGGICLGYSYSYGRYGGGGHFILRDGGLTFEYSGIGQYYHHWKSAILTDQGELYFLYNSMYMPYSYWLVFCKGADLGSVVLRKFRFENKPYSAGNSDMIMDAEGNLYIATSSGMLRSIDDGETWTDAVQYASEASMPSLVSLAIDKDSVIYITWNSENSIYFSTVITRQ